MCMTVTIHQRHFTVHDYFVYAAYASYITIEEIKNVDQSLDIIPFNHYGVQVAKVHPILPVSRVKFR